MLSIVIKHNIDDTIRRLRAQSEAIEKAQVSAVNKAVAQANTRMVRGISAEYRLTQSFVRERLRVKRAVRSGGSSFTVTASLIGNPSGRSKRSMNLIHFAMAKLTRAEKAAWRKGSGMRNPQIPFQIKRAGGRVTVKGAFVANKGRTVFVREGESRLPIKPVRTIGVPQMFSSRKINDDVVRHVNEILPKLFKHELDFYMRRAK
jgi:hypothetical protein